MDVWLGLNDFPKSLDVSKAIDKAARGVPQGGADPTSKNHGRYKTQATEGKRHEGDRGRGFGAGPGQFMVEGGVRDKRDVEGDAQSWQGWGTALKPAHEPIIVARKPIVGTVANNVLTHGTGALNIDATRVGTKVAHSYPNGPGGKSHHYSSDKRSSEVRPDAWEGSEGGRWPANVILTHHEDCEPAGVKKVKGDNRPKGKGKRKSGFVDVGSPNGDGEHCGPVYGDAEVQAWNCHPDCPVRLLDEQTGTLKSGANNKRKKNHETSAMAGTLGMLDREEVSYGDSGGASRFFYCAKVGKKERNAGLDNFATANQHPTVKPIELMRYLCRLVTRPDGVVLDFCAGSGSTGCGAVMEGFRFVGIEREPSYVSIARARIRYWESQA